MIRTMKNSGVLAQQAAGKHPVKLTALLYLKEALLKERYEDCAEIVSVAKEFGAVDQEISHLLEDPRRTPG